MEAIRLGVIGIGNMGSEHCRSILSGMTPELRLHAVADLREQRRAWAAENLPAGTGVFDSGSALIQRGGCDAVLIAAPHYAHEPLAIEALRAGLDVLCEKPMAVTARRAERMLAAARQSGRTLALMFNQRTNGVYRAIHEALSRGELGRIKRVQWTVTDWYRSQRYYDSGAWRATWRGEGGGVLLNQCPHQLDLLIWLCGMPAAVQARCFEGKWHRIEVEDDVTAFMEFEGGATGVFVASTGDYPGTNRLELSGEYGKLVCENGEACLWRIGASERELCFTTSDPWLKLPVRKSVLPTDGDNPQHVGVMNAFAAHLLRGEPLIASAEDGLNAIRLSNAIHLSAWTGERVPLPADADRFEALLAERASRSAGKRVEDVTYDTDHRGTGASMGSGHENRAIIEHKCATDE